MPLAEPQERTGSQPLASTQKSGDAIELELCLPAGTSVEALFSPSQEQNGDSDGDEDDWEDVAAAPESSQMLVSFEA